MSRSTRTQRRGSAASAAGSPAPTEPSSRPRYRDGGATRWPTKPAGNTVTFGTRRPSVIESAIGGTATDPGWDARLPDALQPFADCEWPKVHLIPVARQNTT